MTGSTGRYVVRRGPGYALTVERSAIDALRIGDLAARTAVSALAYFVMPFDAVPDPILGGYADDALVIYSTLAALHGYIQESHIRQAKAWIRGETLDED